LLELDNHFLQSLLRLLKVLFRCLFYDFIHLLKIIFINFQAITRQNNDLKGFAGIIYLSDYCFKSLFWILNH